MSLSASHSRLRTRIVYCVLCSTMTVRVLSTSDRTTDLQVRRQEEEHSRLLCSTTGKPLLYVRIGSLTMIQGRLSSGHPGAVFCSNDPPKAACERAKSRFSFSLLWLSSYLSTIICSCAEGLLWLGLYHTKCPERRKRQREKLWRGRVCCFRGKHTDRSE